MKLAAELKQKINAKRITLGVLVTDHLWPRLIEMCKLAQFDYLIVDCEHGPHNDETVAMACEVGRLIDFPVLIRPVSCAYDVVRRAIDLGPCGFMFPSIETPEQLDLIGEAVLLPPRGKRRPGGWGNSWLPNYQYATWKTQFEDDLIILPQIETRKGLANVAAIAAHELVTAIAVGPYDLSAELACCWEPNAPQLQAALGQIRAAGQAVGKTMWMIGDGATLVQNGYTFICLGDPSALLAQRLGQLVKDCTA